MAANRNHVITTRATVLAVVLSCFLMNECGSRDFGLAAPAGAITLSPSSLVFSNVNMGGSITKSVTVMNTGQGNLVVNRAAVVGRGFRIDGLAVPLTISTGRSTTFDVSFTPSGTDDLVGSVSLDSNASNPSVTLPLTANVRTQDTLVVNDIAVSSISSSSAKITWVTNLPANSQVEFGNTADLKSLSPLNPGEVSDHSVTLTGLSEDQTYHFQVKSSQETGNATVSEDSTFITTAPISATYYVDATNGNDSGAGTSPSAPWKTISKVNSSSFNPGDHILLKRAEVWREQLTVPSSGTQDNFIVFDAYGSGANPIINAADLVTGWRRVDENIWNVQVGWTPNQVFRNQSRMVKKASQTAMVADNQWYFDGSGTLYIFTTADPNTMTFEVSRRDYAFLVSDMDHIALNNVALKYCNSTAGCYLASTTRDRSGFNVTNVDIASSYGPAISFDNSRGSFDSITLTNLTADHCAIIPGGTGSVAFGLGTGGPPFTNVLMIGGHFAYSGVHGDPAVPTWDALGVHLDNVRNSQFIGGVYDHNGSSAFGVQNGSNGLLVSGGAMHDDGSALMGDANELDIGGLGQGSSNITFTGIDLYGSRNALIEIASTDTNEVMSGITITYCRLHSGLSHGFQIGGGHANIIFKYNLIYQNAGNGLFTNEGTSGSPDLLVYNNVFWGNGTGGINTSGVYVNSERIHLRNNIIAQSAGQELVEAGYYALDSDYNLFYHASGGPFMNFVNSSYNLAGWIPQLGQDTHSVSGDPLFVDASTNDYRLNSASPAIHVGFNLGPAFKDALDPRTAFPYGTAAQNVTGSGWNMGAFASF